jgi:tRNA threonylcarbamoyladenosine biosynthesis protein TsaE
MAHARSVLPAVGVPLVTETRSLRGTQHVAARLARAVGGGAVIALAGELGAGKTAFVQGLAQGLGVRELSQVLSPTYTLVNEYTGGRLVLVHLDFYRLASAEAARALGLDEQIGRRDAVTAIEWADLLPELAPLEAIWVALTRLGATSRKLVLTAGRPS